MISDNQRIEWTENPVTSELFDLVENELKNILETPTANCLHYGEAIKSHEALIIQDTQAFMLGVFCEALQGHFGFFEELEDDSDTIESEVDE